LERGILLDIPVLIEACTDVWNINQYFNSLKTVYNFQIGFISNFENRKPIKNIYMNNNRVDMLASHFAKRLSSANASNLSLFKSVIGKKSPDDVVIIWYIWILFL
jgi:hypothetical protein